MPVPSLSIAAAPHRSPTPARPEPRPTAAIPPPPSTPHISYRLDPRLGIPVLQVHDASGKITQSRPTQRQLDAYAKPGALPPAPDGTLA